MLRATAAFSPARLLAYPPGLEFAGEVVAVGAAVDPALIGAQVIAGTTRLLDPQVAGRDLGLDTARMTAEHEYSMTHLREFSPPREGV
jgi:NADPH:quinone reductase-like Zn-dependent oxidoreductase